MSTDKPKKSSLPIRALKGLGNMIGARTPSNKDSAPKLVSSKPINHGELPTSELTDEERMQKMNPRMQRKMAQEEKKWGFKQLPSSVVAEAPTQKSHEERLGKYAKSINVIGQDTSVKGILKKDDNKTISPPKITPQNKKVTFAPRPGRKFSR
jgi:hypothetical protein